MEWLQSVLFDHSALQAVIVLSIIIAVGLALGKIRVCGISLGVTFVFFAGIMAGHIGLSIDQNMLIYAESFGLVLFVYELGLKVGPGFFSSFRKGGVEMNMLGLGVILLGTLMAIGFTVFCDVPMADMVGVLSGATTNTPALGAAQQTLEQLGRSANGAALSCAITYPLGVIGVILALIFARKTFIRPTDIDIHDSDDSNHTYIVEFRVHNPAVYNRTIKDVAALIQPKFVISRLWRNGTVTIPTSETELHANDHLLVVTNDNDVDKLTVLFGEQEAHDWNSGDIDWNVIDSQLISKDIVISRPEINGKTLGSLRLRNTYGINISRIYRSGVVLLATRSLILQLGDTLTVVGEAKDIENVEKVLGNVSVDLKDPN
ncbi:MAG: transporter, partial [Muribaculaceae bacterium]|nr:transporter [Muribaculaceae bacterium]